ncbi:MAG: hypothetical protein ACREMY_08495 [bacterium]
MSKEHEYVSDGEIEPSPITPAQGAFFKWQLALGSYEYARAHGPTEAGEALFQTVYARYTEYLALREQPRKS